MELRIEDVVVADTDGDGVPEILALIVPESSFAQTSQVRRFDAQLLLQGTFDLPWRSVTMSVEPSTFPRKNLLVPTSSGFSAGPPSQLVAVDARSGREVWRSPLLYGQIQRNSVNYLQLGSGPPRISVGTSAGM